jgi:hypothetical protein
VGSMGRGRRNRCAKVYVCVHLVQGTTETNLEVGELVEEVTGF